MEDLNGAALAAADDVVLSEEDGAAMDEHDPQHGYDPAAEALEAEISGEPPKPRRRSPQERIDEVTRARREAERERDYWRDAAAEALQGPPPLPHPADPQAMGAMAAQAEFQHRLSAEVERRAEARVVEHHWTAQQSSFAEQQPDYFEVIHGRWACSEPMADAIRTSEAGAAVAYHLASNPDQARKIAGMTPLAQIREIGRLEARLGREAAGGSTSRTVSGAPSPAPLGRGGGGRFKIDPATADFAAFEKQYGAG